MELSAVMGLLKSTKELFSSNKHDKAHIDLLKTKCDMLVQLIEPYKEENESLVIEITELRKQITGDLESKKFVEKQGAAFKLDIDGTYSDSPYCISCHTQLILIGDMIPYSCPIQSCRRMSNIRNNRQLKEIVKNLNSKNM